MRLRTCLRQKLFKHHEFLTNNEKLLFVGAGKIIQEVSHFLHNRVDQNRFRWMNRTFDKAEALAKTFGGQAVILSSLLC